MTVNDKGLLGALFAVLQTVPAGLKGVAVEGGTQQILPADDADQGAVFQHRQAGDVLLQHHLDPVPHRELGGDGDGMAAHDLVSAPVEGLGVAAHLGLGVQIGADGAEQIPVRNDPHQLLLFQHQQVTKVSLLEDLLDDIEPVIHGNGGDPGRHDVPDKHANLPNPD